MDSTEALLSAFIVFNLALVVIGIYLIKKKRVGQADQADHADLRHKQILEQGKIITAQEKLLKAKQELLNEKERLLESYRKI